MLSLPALVFALIGSNSESEALFAEKNISAVTGINGDDCVILRELADISLFFVDIALAMKTANPILAVAQSLENGCADSGHNSHIKNNID